MIVVRTCFFLHRRSWEHGAPHSSKGENDDMVSYLCYPFLKVKVCDSGSTKYAMRRNEHLKNSKVFLAPINTAYRGVV